MIKDREQISHRLHEDQHIHLDKIKKYFENVLTEQHFINNYGRAKLRNMEPDDLINDVAAAGAGEVSFTGQQPAAMRK